MMNAEQDQPMGAVALESQRRPVPAGDNGPVVVAQEDAGLLGAIMEQDDPLRMKLTAQEAEWAIEIKAMIEMMPDLDNLSDFMYAQLALICKEDINDAVRRVITLQECRQEHGLADTLEDACRGVRKQVQLFPRAILHFSFSKRHGTYFFSGDPAQFNTSALTSEDKVQTFFGGCYYAHHALAPDFETIRKGGVFAMDCGRVNWDYKHDVKIMQQAFCCIFAVYPCQNAMKHYNTGVIFNILSGAFKKALPVRIRDTFETGLTISNCDHLSDICLVPTVEAANERVIRSLQDALKRRYENERSFSLPNE